MKILFETLQIVVVMLIISFGIITVLAVTVPAAPTSSGVDR